MRWHILTTLRVATVQDVHKRLSYKGGGSHREEVALVDDLPLAHLQLCAQLAQLLLILAQQRALVRVLIHVRRVAHALGPVRKLQRAHSLCTMASQVRPPSLGTRVQRTSYRTTGSFWPMLPCPPDQIRTLLL